MAAGIAHRLNSRHAKAPRAPQTAQKIDIPGTSRSETVILANDDVGDSQGTDQHRGNKLFGCQAGKVAVKVLDQSPCNTVPRDGLQLDQGRHELLWGNAGIEHPPGVRIEREDHGIGVQFRRSRARNGQKLLMPSVNSIEVPDRHHATARSLRNVGKMLRDPHRRPHIECAPDDIRRPISPQTEEDYINKDNHE